MPRRPFVAGLLAAGLVVGLVQAVGAPAATAHTEVLRAEPAPASTVSGVVDEVRLVFLDPVQPGVSIDVRDDAGDAVAGLGEARLDEDATVARVGFDPLTEPGGYVVAYRFTALDGDTQRQTYRFTFDLSSSPAAAADGDAGGDSLPVTTVAGIVILTAVVVPIVVTAFLRRRKESPTQTTK